VADQRDSSASTAADDSAARAAADRRMTASEALMWRTEKDPFLSSTFGTVTIHDRPVDLSRLRTRMERAIDALPRLGWRVVSSTGDLGLPIWADDPGFDIDRHVLHVHLPRPGTRAQLLELANQFVLEPLDRTRPLWQFLVVDGLRGGKGALVQKMHHTISDGVNAIRMAAQYMDLDRDAEAPVGGFAEERVVSPVPISSPVDVIRDVIETGLRFPMAVAKQMTSMLTDPTTISTASTTAVDTVKAVVTQLSDTEPARSPLWRARSLERRIVTARTRFGPTRAAARRLGGTVNTAFLTAVTEAASRYHVEFDQPVDQLRATMAVSTRTDDSPANAFSLVRMLVPTGEMPLRERFEAIADTVEDARQATGSANLDLLATVASALPTSVLTRIVRQQAQTVDFATSNVRGAPVPVYVAGARLLESYPIGPLVGVAFNATVLSYDGHLDFGVNVDTEAVADPARLGALVQSAANDVAKL